MRDVATKQATRSLDPIVVAFGVAAVPALALGAVVLAGGPAAPGAGFGLALAVSGSLNILATPLLVWALERSDLSLVAPLTSLTPLFMVATGAVVLGEVPSATGVAGVVVIVAGAYLLTISERGAGLLAPFRALLSDPGARAMLLVAFLYSITSTYDKVGTRASSPLVWAASIHAVVALALAPLAVRRMGRIRRMGGMRRTRPLRAHGEAATPARAIGRLGAAPATLLAGVVTAVGAAAQMTALMLTLAAYVIAVKRTSTLFGVLLGHSLFRERNVRERLLGAAVMLAGFLMVTLG